MRKPDSGKADRLDISARVHIVILNTNCSGQALEVKQNLHAAVLSPNSLFFTMSPSRCQLTGVIAKDGELCKVILLSAMYFTTRGKSISVVSFIFIDY